MKKNRVVLMSLCCMFLTGCAFGGDGGHANAEGTTAGAGGAGVHVETGKK